MKRLIFYLKLICEYMRLGIIKMTQYPVDTIIMFISMLLREIMGLIGILAISGIIGELGGWGIYEIVLLFSMCAIIESFGMAFFDGIWSLDIGVRKGRMDAYYVRPVSIFVQVLGSVQHYQAIISFFVYIGMLVLAINKLNISFSVGNIFFLVEFFVCGTIINTGIYTISNSLNFWIIQGESIAELVHTCRDFAKYPLHLFPTTIKRVFTFVLPFGFVGYYPAAFFSGKGSANIPVSMFIITILVASVAFFVWKRGVKDYGSTGN